MSRLVVWTVKRTTVRNRVSGGSVECDYIRNETGALLGTTPAGRALEFCKWGIEHGEIESVSVNSAGDLEVVLTA